MANLAPPPSGPDLGALQAQHDHTTALYGKTSDAGKTLRSVRGALDKLKALGDKVSMEDVIQAGGTLVGAGLSPQAVSAMMAQLPQGGGEALAGWVAQQDAQVTQREAMQQQVHEATRHHMGVNALRLVMGHHLGGGQADGGSSTGSGGSSASGPSGNGLVPGMPQSQPGGE